MSRKTLPILSLPAESLFIDAATVLIEYNDQRTEPNPNGKGYQRDPFRRKAWMTKHAGAEFDPSLCRVLEVSKRPNGKYAILDGGGRWTIGQMSGVKTFMCRVHSGLTRQEESALFVKFDREIYRLRAIDVFLADMASGNEVCNAVGRAVAPYYIEASGIGSLSCVGALVSIYTSTNARLLSRTAKIVANTWGGLTKGGGWGKNASPEGHMIAAVAMVIEMANGSLDEERLRTVLERNRPEAIIKEVLGLYPDTKTVPMARMAARHIVDKYNHGRKGSENRLQPSRLDDTAIWSSYSKGRSYSSMIREIEAEDADADDKAA